MILPRRMKFVEFTVLKNDIDDVLEYLGKKAAIQFPEAEDKVNNTNVAHIKDIIERLRNAAEFLSVKIPSEFDENVSVPGKDDEEMVQKLCSSIESLKENEIKTIHEKKHVHETIREAKAFSKMNVAFSDFEHLSYLTLRLGRLDPKSIPALRETLGERAVIIPLEASGNRVLAASSKKGRFALDSQLKKASFEPIKVPEDYRGVPAEMMKSLNEQYAGIEKKLDKIRKEKEQFRKLGSVKITRLISSWHTALIIEGIKARFTTTESMYHFSGWTPADTANEIAKDLSELTYGRIAIRSYSPDEVPSIKSGKEKVPVALKHNAFVKGFESVVFSYGAPLYGTIDPTPLVAFFFTLMFGIMFGDAGQGAVLLFTGLLIKKGNKKLKAFSKYSTPLVSVGISSMIMGLLAGSVFTNEHLLVAVTRAITAAVTGHPMDRILHILPMAGEGGSITKLFYFFGFTVGIGVVINSLGLIINIFNRCTLKKYEAAFFSKTGLAGLFMFWYAISIALRLLFGAGSFQWFDFIGLLLPVFCIFFGPVIWRIIAKKKPVLENGMMVFIMEGFVEVLETVSTYISNTVSFLRVGAFALAHAVFSFIIFYFTDELAGSGIAGAFSAALIMIAGNIIIIALEGLIVAIQVIRLQYYEFFNKFFVETGVEFAPFQFKTQKM
ncbi:MAG: V-type ATP synthase subunit I [Treponema sp.]|nr:V-type ATP synthase subunit I [Treponema sp.]